jgi:hypothetical protein
MKEEEFNPIQSLQLIQSMIDKTKQDISHKSVYFLVWGWLTFIACTAQFILKHVYNCPRHYYVWWIILAGVIFSFYRSKSDDKNQRVKTYVGESIKYLWIGMGISYFVLSMILSKIGWDHSVFPFFIMLYGLGTFVSGAIIKFRPLVIGAILAWLLAIGAVFVEYDYQMLFAAAAILVSYIIPAYILKAKETMVKEKQVYDYSTQ